MNFIVPPQKVLRILMLICLVAVFPYSLSAQNERITFPATNIKAARAMGEIEAQTGYKFAYEKSVFNPESSVVFSSSLLSLTEALSELSASSGVDLVIKGRFIVAAPKVTASSRPRQLFQSPVKTREAQVKTPASTIEPTQHTQERIVIEEDPWLPLPGPYSDFLPIDRYASIHGAVPRISAKINVLYGIAALAPNLAVEIGLSERTSLEVSAGFNGWNKKGTYDNNSKLMHYYVRPEFRYWFCECHTGHFVGVNVFHSLYNIGGYDLLGKFEKGKRYEGQAFGAGVAYGYHLPLSSRWGIEFNVGFGVARMKDLVFDCTKCSDATGSLNRWYAGPTRAGVTMVFIIK